MGLPFPISIWAPVGSTYPPGAPLWAGQPVSLAPPGTWFTPNTKPAAEEFNYLFNYLTANLELTREALAAVIAQNWTPEFHFFTTGSANMHQAAAWDPVGHLWVMGVQRSAGPYVEVYTTAGADEGASAAWTQLGTSSGPGVITPAYLAVCADATTPGTYWFTATLAGGAGNSAKTFYWDGATWSQKWFTSVTGSDQIYDAEMATLNGYVIVALAANAANSTITSSNDHGATTSVFSPGNPGRTLWRMKSNGTQVVAIGNDSQPKVFSTTDGHTWTTSTSLGGIMASGDQVVGLAWTADVIGQCWLAAINPASPGNPYWARSSDGLTWTKQAGGVSTGHGFVITDMAAVGSLLVCTLNDISQVTPVSLFSPDGGISWYYTQAGFTSNNATSVAGYSFARVAESPVGFLMFNNLWARFSNQAGLDNPI